MKVKLAEPCTVLGASGFIGRHLVEHLKGEGVARILRPEKGASLQGETLGTVFYCCGVTGDFRSDIPNLVDSHVSSLVRCLSGNRVDRIVYLSSTRVYGTDAAEGALPSAESDPVSLSPDDPDQVYQASKILGEMTLRSLCEDAGVGWCILRLSNVVGYDPLSPNMLWQLIREMSEKGKLTFRSSPDSARDYVSLDDVIKVMVRAAGFSESGTFNVASGDNITNADFAEALGAITGISAVFQEGGERRIGPPVSVRKLSDQFGLKPSTGMQHLPEIWKRYRKHLLHETRN